MAKKGERKSQKRISASSALKINRKEFTWLIKTKPGRHKKDECIALGVLVRDFLPLAENMKEARIILSQGNVLVDGIVRKSPKFGVGLFDVIHIPVQKKFYRIVLDDKGRLEIQEIPEKEGAVKLCKVVGKKAVDNGMIQIETNDGRTIVGKKSALSCGDSILISVPGQKIEKELRLEKGSLVYLIGGEHASRIAKVKEVIGGTMKRPRLVSLEEKESSFLTVAENVFVVGVNKPEISLKV